MLADVLTKLAPAPVIQVLHNAMNGVFPSADPKMLHVGDIHWDDDGAMHTAE